VHGASPDGLLAPDEPGPYELVGERTARRLVLVCDHAGRRIPRSLGSLGLPQEATWRHIAWDIGAAELTVALAHRLSATALLATYSRLVIDCNRDEDHPTACSEAGDGHRVRGNEALSPDARSMRVRAIHTPYHQCLAALLDERVAVGPAALVSVHSFTPVLHGEVRPWVAGVLWDQDDRIAVPLLKGLRDLKVGLIGDNEPYSGRLPAAYTVHRHGAARGIPHVSIEIRQDGLLTPGGIAVWADALAATLEPILAHLRVTP
jgi:predicted N-formylglutamate amidohydrolase